LPGFAGLHAGGCRGDASDILRDIEGHALAPLYHHRVVAVDRTQSKKDIFAFVAPNEAGAYLLVEPFYPSRRHGPDPPSSGDCDAKLTQLPTEENKE
jgi:hypothetical protein